MLRFVISFIVFIMGQSLCAQSEFSVSFEHRESMSYDSLTVIKPSGGYATRKRMLGGRTEVPFGISFRKDSLDNKMRRILAQLPDSAYRQLQEKKHYIWVKFYVDCKGNVLYVEMNIPDRGFSRMVPKELWLKIYLELYKIKIGLGNQSMEDEYYCFARWLSPYSPL